MRLFADDACLSYQHNDPEYLNEVINKELGKVDKWFWGQFSQKFKKILKFYLPLHFSSNLLQIFRKCSLH